MPAVNAAAANHEDYVIINSRYYDDLKEYELIDHRDAKTAAEEQIGAQCASNAARAETFGRTLFKNLLTATTYLGLSILKSPSTSLEGAIGGIVAERFADNVTDSKLGKGLTWLTGKALGGGAAFVTGAYHTAQVYNKGNTAAQPSPLAIARATRNYQPAANT